MRASAQVWGIRGDVPAVTTDLRPLGTQAPPSLNKTIEHDLRLRHMHTPAARMHHSPIRGCPHWRPDAHHTRRGTSPSYEVEVRASHTGHRSTQGCSGWWNGCKKCFVLLTFLSRTVQGERPGLRWSRACITGPLCILAALGFHCFSPGHQ